MASQDDEDFEISHVIHNLPVVIRSKHDLATCSDFSCQTSRVSKEGEFASERAIEPLIAIMQATSTDLETQGPIFHANINSSTNRNTIYDTFLGGLPMQHRQAINCHACKQFLKQYGDLCIVGEDGGLVPLSFPKHSNVPQHYKKSVKAVIELFEDKSVGDEFKIPKERTLGSPTKGGWRHLSVTLENVPNESNESTSNSQDTFTSFRMLHRILEDNSPEVIARVYHLIHENQLPYAESHKSHMTYLKDTVEKLSAQDTKRSPVSRKNLITKYARSAFPGCLSSLRSGVLGFLFKFVNEGQDFETLRLNWMKKASPLSYLHPTAAPSNGNIETAEKIFAQMSYRPRDLERVFLTLDQVPQRAILWFPPTSNLSAQSVATSEISGSTTLCEIEDPSKTTKLFSKLLPNEAITPTSYADAPIKDISFRQFVLKVLPAASIIEAFPTNSIQPYFFTSGKPGSKPVFSFHSDAEGSHTASWYKWSRELPLFYANLQETPTRVKAIITFPHMWDDLEALEVFDEAKIESFQFKRHGIRLLFVLEGAKDMAARKLALFPILVKGVFHSVRKTVEAFSVLEGAEEMAPRKLALFPMLAKEVFHSVRKTVEAFSNQGRIEQPNRDGHVGGISVEKDTDIGGKGIVLGVQTKTGQVSRYCITLFE